MLPAPTMPTFNFAMNCSKTAMDAMEKTLPSYNFEGPGLSKTHAGRGVRFHRPRRAPRLLLVPGSGGFDQTDIPVVALIHDIDILAGRIREDIKLAIRQQVELDDGLFQRHQLGGVLLIAQNLHRAAVFDLNLH